MQWKILLTSEKIKLSIVHSFNTHSVIAVLFNYVNHAALQFVRVRFGLKIGIGKLKILGYLLQHCSAHKNHLYQKHVSGKTRTKCTPIHTMCI